MKQQLLTLYGFLALPIKSQCQYLERHCTYLLHRYENETTKVYLHFAHSFFVEVWFDSLEITIVRLRPFSNRNLLDPYLEQLDIRSLFE